MLGAERWIAFQKADCFYHDGGVSQLRCTRSLSCAVCPVTVQFQPEYAICERESNISRSCPAAAATPIFSPNASASALYSLEYRLRDAPPFLLCHTCHDSPLLWSLCLPFHCGAIANPSGEITFASSSTIWFDVTVGAAYKFKQDRMRRTPHSEISSDAASLRSR